MPCYHPLTAFRLANGSIVFAERGDVVRQLQLPCGQCVGCRLERSRQWAMRCVHEASLYEDNCFITLTYAPEHLPHDGGLHYRDFQLFLKRFRKEFPNRKIRFYMAGEYGEQNFRPHFHAILFNFNFSDRKLHTKTPSGSLIYTSEVLERLWPYGYSSVGDMSFESAAYVARYVMKKITGNQADDHYRTVNTDTGEVHQIRPEFNKMSLKPGIGAAWFEKYHSDVYPHDHVIVNGQECKPPKYYDKLIEKLNPDVFEEIKYFREVDSKSKYHDNTDTRLLVKEKVTNARLSQLHRKI